MKLKALFGALFLVSLGCQDVYEFPHREEYAHLRSVQRGWTEAEVRTKLGVPVAGHPAGTPPSVYCIEGRFCHERPVTGKLLIYTYGKPTAFYFLDPAGRVEHVFVGGS